jgi:type IV secretion system protein VirB1
MWADLAVECAPNVAPPTMMAIIRVESGGDPLALNVNHAKVQPAIPKTAPEVAALAKEWISRGFTVDLGLAQINSANLPHLGLTVERVLDPCTNLRAAATILSANYAEAARTHGPGQRALQAALSAYNTGDFARGFTNGYVQRFYGPVPAVPSRAVAVDKKPTSTYSPYTAKSATWPTARPEVWGE